MIHKVLGACVSVEYLSLGMLENNVYIISEGDHLMVVDPSCKPKAILEALEGRVPDVLLLTHWHADHVGAARALREASGAKVVASAIDAPLISGEVKAPSAGGGFEPCPVDQTVEQGEVFRVGSMPWKVLITPGHTKGSMCLYLNPANMFKAEGSPLLVSGDTLFQASYGRTDFAGGDSMEMRDSLRRLSKLPDETIVLPGHNGLTTIGEERGRVL